MCFVLSAVVLQSSRSCFVLRAVIFEANCLCFISSLFYIKFICETSSIAHLYNSNFVFVTSRWKRTFFDQDLSKGGERAFGGVGGKNLLN